MTFKMRTRQVLLSCKRSQPLFATLKVFVGFAALTSLGDHLRAAQVEVDGIAVVLSQLSRLNEHLWVIGTKLQQRHAKMRHNDISLSANIIKYQWECRVNLKSIQLVAPIPKFQH